MFLIFFSGLTVYSQAMYFTDSLKQPITGIKALVTDSSNVILSISYTDNQGKLNFQFKLAQDYRIKTSHHNYKKLEKVVRFNKKTEIQNIILTRKISELDEILINAEKTIKKVGDTTYINLKPFALPTDKTIDQVMSRIPGMVVTKDGTIRYKGKDITDILINGRKLFDRDYSDALSFINSSKILELKVIEKYNDDKGFKTTDINSQAIDLLYKGKNIYSSLINAGVGNKKTYLGNYAHVLANRLLSNFIKFEAKNLGQTDFNSKIYTRSHNLKYQTLILPSANQGLNDVYGLFIDSFSTDANFNLPIGDKADEAVKVKYSYILEESEYQNTAEINFSENTEVINRTEQKDQNLLSDKHLLFSSYKVQTERWFNISSVEFERSLVQENKTQVINLQDITESKAYNDTELSVSSKLQFRKYERRPYELQLHLSHKRLDNTNTSSGINSINQSFTSNSTAISSMVDIPLEKNKIFKISYKSQLDYIKLNFDLNRLGTNAITANQKEQIGIWTQHLHASLSKNKKIKLNFVPQLFIINSKSTVSNVSEAKFVVPTVEVDFKLGNTSNSFSTRHYYSRVNNNASFLPLFFNENTISQSVNFANPFSEISEYSYDIRWGEYYNRTKFSANVISKKNIAITDFDFDENSTVLESFNLDRTQRQYQLTVDKDFLILKKLSLKASISWLRIKSFQSSLNEVLKFENDNYIFELNSSKRIGKRWFFRTISSLSQNLVRIENSQQTKIFSFKNDIALDFNTKKSVASVELISNDFGSGRLLNFLNFSYKYDLNKMDSQIKLRLINILNIDKIVTENISPQIRTRNSIQLQGRRAVISWSYFF